MLEIRDKFEGNICIKEDTALHGMIKGNVMISDNAIFIIHGMVVGNLIIENAKVFIHGMAKGNVTNRSGLLEVYGMIKGKIHKEGGETIIHPKAKVNFD